MYRALRNKATEAFVRLFQTATKNQAQPEHWRDSALLSKPGALPAQPQQYSVSDATVFNCFTRHRLLTFLLFWWKVTT